MSLQNQINVAIQPQCLLPIGKNDRAKVKITFCLPEPMVASRWTRYFINMDLAEFRLRTRNLVCDVADGFEVK